MAKPSDHCDPRRLDRFLRDRLPDDFRRDLEDHLQVCPACRHRLDQLAGGPRWWSEVQHYLGGDGADHPASTADRGPRPRPMPIDLDFLEPSDDPAALGRLGGYEVQEVLGRGGMGVVLKAFDRGLHRPVAIKVLAAEYAARGAARKRFAREARAAAAVVHDHVVPVHAVDPDATPPYLVMAFIPGQSLQQRLDRSGPLELKEILRIGMQTAAGLAAAHAQGLVHRDIKPANIMLENGIERVRITDFGLARAVDDATLTQSGAVAGTPHYMAPEQARGEPVDQRADLFSLGSTLYAMATGRPPFRGESGLVVLRQVCDLEPAPLRGINPDVPAWLEGIVHKLHAKDPARRFQSAAEVAELLERCLAHVQQPDRHPLPRPAKELGRQCDRPRRPRRWRVAGAALAAVVLFATLLWFFPEPTARRRPGADEQAPSARSIALSLDAGELARLDGEPDQAVSRLKARLDGLEQELAAAGADGPDSLQPTLTDLRCRAEALRRDLDPGDEPAHDPVAAGLAEVRRRLAQLRQDLVPPLEQALPISR